MNWLTGHETAGRELDCRLLIKQLASTTPMADHCCNLRRTFDRARRLGGTGLGDVLLVFSNEAIEDDFIPARK